MIDVAVRFYRLMGVDVASFGDFFADKRITPNKTKEVSRVTTKPPDISDDKSQPSVQITSIEQNESTKSENMTNSTALQASSTKRGRKKDEPIQCLVYKDPFSSTYKKYIFTADGKYLLGGMMIGDVADYVKLVSIVKKKVDSALLNFIIRLTIRCRKH
jgi:nitrite reductase (NAD(P)H)